MKISGISGLVSVIFLTVVFPVSLIPVYHYWREKSSRAIGQRKKRRMRTLMRRWICVAIIAVIIGLIGAAGYYFAPTVILMQPSERQYVSIIQGHVELTAGEAVIFMLDIENGPGETTLTFHDVTPKIHRTHSREVFDLRS